VEIEVVDCSEALALPLGLLCKVLCRSRIGYALQRLFEKKAGTGDLNEGVWALGWLRKVVVVRGKCAIIFDEVQIYFMRSFMRFCLTGFRRCQMNIDHHSARLGAKCADFRFNGF